MVWACTTNRSNASTGCIRLYGNSGGIRTPTHAVAKEKAGDDIRQQPNWLPALQPQT
ncbi:MAG: hypothetical protein MI749_03665 [Desulfovibrionales bacterium]|nr:hypothetical protein [Desulfovibrionales bacterium]